MSTPSPSAQADNLRSALSLVPTGEPPVATFARAFLHPLTGAVVCYVDNAGALVAADGVPLVTKNRAVRVATTANITIATALNAGDTLDGITLAAGDNVLVKDQATPSQNGIYTVSANPARSAEFDSWNELVASSVSVQEGNTFAGSSWVNSNNASGTLGTTSIVWRLVLTSRGAGDPPASVANTIQNTLGGVAADHIALGVPAFWFTLQAPSGAIYSVPGYTAA